MIMLHDNSRLSSSFSNSFKLLWVWSKLISRRSPLDNPSACSFKFIFFQLSVGSERGNWERNLIDHV